MFRVGFERASLLFALAGILGLGFILARSSGAANKTQLPETANDLARLSQEVRRLGKAVRDAPVQVTQVLAVPARNAGDTVSVGVPVPAEKEEPLNLADEATRRKLADTHQAQIDLVQDTFDRDSVDPTWSRQAADSLRSAYSGADFGAVKLAVDCRRAICKLELTGSTQKDVQDAIQSMIQRTPWPTNGITLLDPKLGTGSIYLAREGTQLPQLDSQ